MKLSLEDIWKVGGVIVLAVALYYRVEYLEKDHVRLESRVEQLEQDLKFTTNNLLRFEYGEYAVEK